MKATSASVGAGVSMVACDMSSNLQEWRFGTDGTVRHPNSGLCLASLGGSEHRAHAADLRWQLDDDGRADLCMRAPIPGDRDGLRCTYAP